MTKRRLLAVGGLVVAGAVCLLLFLSAGSDSSTEASRDASPVVAPPSGWPQRLGERMFHECEFGFV